MKNIYFQDNRAKEVTCKNVTKRNINKFHFTF